MQKRSINRWIGLILTTVFALTACTPDARSVTTPDATEQTTSGGVPSPTPDFFPYYGDRPPQQS